MSETLQKYFIQRLRDAGIDPETPVSYGWEPVAQHAETHQLPIDAWLPALEGYIQALHKTGGDLWPPLRFGLSAALTVSGNRPETFKTLLSTIGDLLTTLAHENIPRSRTEEYALEVCAQAFAGDDAAFVIALNSARRLAENHIDPGWFLQLTMPALWKSRPENREHFEARLRTLETTLSTLQQQSINVTYPMAVGLQYLALQNTDPEDHWTGWLEHLTKIARSLKANDLDVYGFFEYSFASLAIPASYISRTLEVALTLADHGILPTALKPLSSMPSAIDAAAQLANEGIDPYLILIYGFPSVIEFLGGEKEIPRLLALARELHLRGYSFQNTFEKGFLALSNLEKSFPGIFARGFSAAELLAQRGLDPGLTLAYGLPRVLSRYASDRPWLVDACFQLIDSLASSDIDPEAFLSYAVPSLLALTGMDRSAFESLATFLTQFIVTLKSHGIEHRDVLFYDIQSLTDVEGESAVFVDILKKLEALMNLLVTHGRDPSPFLLRGLPAATRYENKSHWLIPMIIDISGKMMLEDRDPLPLLEHAVESLSKAAAGDEAVFRAFWSVLEKHLTELPPDLEPLIEAAIQPAHQEPTRFEEALRTLLQRYASPETPITLRPNILKSIPVVAPLAENPTDLGIVWDALRDGLAFFPKDENPAMYVWRTTALATISAAFTHRTQIGLEVILAIARKSQEWKEYASVVLRHGTKAAAGVANGDAAIFLKILDQTAAAAQQMAEKAFNVEWTFPHVMNVVSLASQASARQFADVLMPLMEWVLQAGPTDSGNVTSRLDLMEIFLARWPQGWSALLAPTLKAHGRHAGELLATLSHVGMSAVRQPSDLDVLREVVTQNGVRSLDILSNLIWPAVREGALKNLTAQKKILTGFIREMVCWDPNLFAQYAAICQDTNLTEAQRRAKILQLRESFSELSNAIRSGDMTPAQENNSLFGMALIYIFPPATSTPRQSYVELYERFPDRQADLDSRDPGDTLRRFYYPLSEGSWQRREGATPDPALWMPFFEIIHASSTNETLQEPGPFGWELLRAWTETRLGRERSRQEFLPQAFTRMRRNGIAFPNGWETAAQLLAIKEILSDRMRDCIEEALLTCRQEDPERYERLIRSKLATTPTMGPKLAKAVLATLEAFRSGHIAETDAVRRLSGQLREFLIDEKTLLDSLKEATSVETLRIVLTTLGPRPIALEAGQEITRLQADWLGQDLHAMQEELFGTAKKSGLLEYRESSSTLEMIFEVTKRRAHAVIGYAEGVCVAPDLQLWNNPDFLQTIFWDDGGIARGGMHLLIVEGKYLCLPGINPSMALLERVNASVLLDAAVNYAWRLARAWKLEGVWIPASAGIHSNRLRIGQEIASRAWRVKETPEYQFSYSPFSYSFSSVLEVPEPTHSSRG